MRLSKEFHQEIKIYNAVQLDIKLVKWKMVHTLKKTGILLGKNSNKVNERLNR